MKRIKVIAGVLNVSQGARVVLSAAQAKSRAHKIAPVAGDVDGLFVAAAPLQFKAGEQLSVTEVAKGQLDQVEFLDREAEQGELVKSPARAAARSR